MKHLAALLLLVCCAICCTGALGCSGGYSDSIFPDAASDRTPAPQFQATALNGDVYTHRSLRGKTVLVTFWATWCPICRHDLEKMKLLHQRLKPQGLEILAIAIDDTPQQVQRYQRQLGASFPLLLDDGLMKAAFEVQAIPVTFVLNSRGEFKPIEDPQTKQRSFQLLGPRNWDGKEAFVSLYRSLNEE